MARTVGIDAGDFEVRAVELDGSYKKTRLTRIRFEPLPPGAAADAAAVAAAIAAALSEGKLGGTPVLGHPCREAVLRTIELPFQGRDAIRKIIKAEVEGVIHSHAVDDMVIDFHELGPGQEGTRVLIAAVPKPSLGPLLEELARLKVEPEHVDLDTMALFRTAEWCGAFAAQPAEPATDAATGAAAGTVPVPAGSGAPLTAVLDLGERSTRLLLVEGGKLADMRTLRLGDGAIAESIARSHELPLAVARDAVHGCLATGGDFVVEVEEAAPAAEGKSEQLPVPVATTRQVAVAHQHVEAEQVAYLQRLARELVRFLAATGRASSIRTLWITGSGSRLPGIQDLLQEAFGCPPRELDILSRLQHSLPEEQAAAVAPHLAVPVGLALSGLGGAAGFDFRQEELAFTRGFDRMKFPLAITCMVALFAAVVFAVQRNNELKNLHYQLGATYTGDKADAKNPVFWGMLNAVLASGWFKENRYFNHEVGGKDYGYRNLLQDLAARPVPERLRFVRDKLRLVLDRKQQESGIYEEVTLESGLAVLSRTFDVLKRAEPALGKYLLCDLELNMRATGVGERSGRFVRLRLAFRGNDFRDRMAALRAAIDEECRRDDSPFLKFDEAAYREILFTAPANEPVVPGAFYDVRIIVRDSFDPFREVRG